MTTSEFFENVAIIAALMALAGLIELGVPLFARGVRSHGRSSANLGLSLLTLALNWPLISMAGPFAGEGRGALAQLALPLPALVMLSVVALDLATYVAHRSMHAIPLLWRAHSVHHSDPFLDVSTTLRQHPLEGLWRSLWIFVPARLLGLPAVGVVTYRLLSVAQGVFEHANIRVWPPLDRLVSLVWVTPNMHKVHHSRVRTQTDSNYGNLFALFDRLLRTFRPTDEAFAVDYGLDDVAGPRARSLPGLLGLPFARSQTR
jgi:sterol desaturase/sphingolipid hydroxylase (fatty acid hydroxylase superfamily)